MTYKLFPQERYAAAFDSMDSAVAAMVDWYTSTHANEQTFPIKEIRIRVGSVTGLISVIVETHNNGILHLGRK